MKKTFNNLLTETKMNLLKVQFANRIQEEIDKLDCTGKDEISYFSCQAYEEGLKKSLEILKELTENQ